MRRLALFVLALFVILLGAACGEAADPGDKEIGEAIGDVPSPIDEDTELVWQGTVYKATGFIAPDDVGDYDLEQVGTTNEASIPFEGEIPVYRRDGEEDTIYTPPVFQEGDEVFELWARWLPAEATSN